ncbi:MAG: fused MFS/spermidine synthase [Candidatus Eremiobacteraeota bacterium]|nr:fused MFS/spermidine synthase [Candidatus Eremiobacteraeota bacterium]
MLLPHLGGAPAVWNTCVVFYQLILLAGYYYVFLLRRWATPRVQLIVHLALVLVVLAFLPLRIHAFSPAPLNNGAILWVLVTLTLSLGVPLLALTATSPLLQAWFGATTHERAHDPYFLYAASNAGSLLGLLCYPFALEPLLGIREQGSIWTVGYAALLLLVFACAAVFFRSATLPAAQDAESAPADEPIQLRRKMRWLVLAFIPASLMLSATTYISTVIAPIPLIWVAPLALYLITLILAFSAGLEARLARLRRFGPWFVLPLVVILAAGVSLSVPLMIFIHLTAFFLISLTCHSLLAADRPPKAHLPEFYLWLAAGGAAGGLFSAIIAPLIFRTLLEYQLVLVLAAFFLREPPKDNTPSRVQDWYLPLGLGAALALFISFRFHPEMPNVAIISLITFSVAALIALVAFRRPLAFAVSVGAMVACGILLDATTENTLYVARNFFGQHTVLSRGPFHLFYHGTTLHGLEDMRPAHQRVPLSYYTHSGPLGQMFALRAPELAHASIGVIGLGAGSELCYRTPEQRWTIYEIDPIVDRIARDQSLFKYVSGCAQDVPTVLGDARLSLEQAPDASYDLLLLDAYSSDYVPVHLITREAVQLYTAKLTDHGILAFHVSNRWFALQRVLGSISQSLGMTCYLNFEQVLTIDDLRRGKSTSDWIVLARSDADLGAITQDHRWRKCPPTNFRVWTDDYSSLVTAIPVVFKIGN